MRVSLRSYNKDLTKNVALESNDIIRNTHIIDYKRYIICYKPTEDQPAGSVIVKNVVRCSKPPLIAAEIKDIRESVIISTFLMEPYFYNEFERNKSEKKMRLLCGITTGFGYLKPDGYINYGISILNLLTGGKIDDDMVYSIIEEGFVDVFTGGRTFETEVLFFNPYLDEDCEYIGPVQPNFLSECHWEYLMEKPYPKNNNTIDLEYDILKLKDEKTQLFEIGINTGFYHNGVDDGVYSIDDIQFTSLFNELMFLCYIHDYIDITIYIENGEFNINWNKVSRSFNYSSIKNNYDMKSFVDDLSVSVTKFKHDCNRYSCTFIANSASFSMRYTTDLHPLENYYIRDRGSALSELTYAYSLYRKAKIAELAKYKEVLLLKKGKMYANFND